MAAPWLSHPASPSSVTVASSVLGLGRQVRTCYYGMARSGSSGNMPQILDQFFSDDLWFQDTAWDYGLESGSIGVHRQLGEPHYMTFSICSMVFMNIVIHFRINFMNGRGMSRNRSRDFLTYPETYYAHLEQLRSFQMQARRAHWYRCLIAVIIWRLLFGWCSYLSWQSPWGVATGLIAGHAVATALAVVAGAFLGENKSVKVGTFLPACSSCLCCLCWATCTT